MSATDAPATAAASATRSSGSADQCPAARCAVRSDAARVRARASSSAPTFVLPASSSTKWQSGSRFAYVRIMESLAFDGKVAIITGAGGGLGRCHALDLARRGARVVVNDLGAAVDGSGASTSAAQSVVDEIVAAGGTAIANGDSVASEDGGAAIVAAAMDAF